MSNKSNQYQSDFKKYINLVNEINTSISYKHSLEASFESLNDWSLFLTLDELKVWFNEKRNNSSMKIEEIGINELKGWKVNPKDGNISHNSKHFFMIRGLRVHVDSREVSGGWDQPIIEQVGYDGGILGIIRKRFDGVPHYLCEAKSEPGNYGGIQLSPTLQATFSNLNQKHNGIKPYFSEFFEKMDTIPEIKVLFDAWLSEDGGRLYKKRNRGILIEIPESTNLELPNDNFCWVSLFQIKQLLSEDGWINPHIRGILSHV
jgi:dTDP-4-dehydro-6-deoxy-alpha-D-glucopyranose 2,3-dehydratase